jgi:hypothetical protein
MAQTDARRVLGLDEVTEGVQLHAAALGQR